MDLIFPQGFNHDCNACGRCCKMKWWINVNKFSYERLKETEFLKKAEEKRGAPPIRKVTEDTYGIAHKEDGACTFQMPNNLCEMHAEIGYDMKPTACQQFPFILRPTPDGVYVGLSHYCDAVQRNEGGALDRFETNIRTWLTHTSYSTVTEENLWLDDGIKLEWEAYKAYEAWLLKQMDEQAEPMMALWFGVLAACRLAVLYAEKGVKRVTREMFEHSIEHEISQQAIWDKSFYDFTQFNVAAVVAVFEASNRELRKPLREAILAGEEYFSPLLNKQVSVPAMRAYGVKLENVGWNMPAFRRYLSHVVFRKFLTGPEPLTAMVSSLFIAAMVLDFYFTMSAYASGRPASTEEDLWKAVEIVELRFLAHNFGLQDLYRNFASGFQSQIKLVDQAEAVR